LTTSAARFQLTHVAQCSLSDQTLSGGGMKAWWGHPKESVYSTLDASCSHVFHFGRLTFVGREDKEQDIVHHERVEWHWNTWWDLLLHHQIKCVHRRQLYPLSQVPE